MLDATQDAGWGGGDVNVPCTCTHVGCYARCWVGLGRMLYNVPCICTHVGCYARGWVGVGGMLTFLALAHTCWKLRKVLGWGGGDVNVPCTCAHVGCNGADLVTLICSQVWVKPVKS